jgi:hypothetical protein
MSKGWISITAGCLRQMEARSSPLLDHYHLRRTGRLPGARGPWTSPKVGIDEKTSRYQFLRLSWAITLEKEGAPLFSSEMPHAFPKEAPVELHF